MIDSTILGLGVFAMLVTMFLSIIPFVPGPALVWAVGMVIAVANDFERITVLAVIIMTIFMILGSTTEFWLKALGMRGRGTSCWGTLGSFIGGLIGTLIMPLIGTLIGAIIGALIVEFMRLGEWREALKAGQSAFEMFVLGMIVEFGMSFAIFVTFVGSILLTA